MFIVNNAFSLCLGTVLLYVMLTGFLSSYLKIPVVANADMPDFQLVEIMELLYARASAQKMASKTKVRRSSQHGLGAMKSKGIRMIQSAYFCRFTSTITLH